MEACTPAGGGGKVMIVKDSIARPETARIPLGQHIIPSVVLSVLFLSAFLRDVPLNLGAIASWRRDIVDVFNVETQFWLCGAVGVYLLFFIAANWRAFAPRDISGIRSALSEGHTRVWLANLLLLPILVCVGTRYVRQYKEAGGGTDALVFLICVLLNQWLIWVLGGRRDNDIAGRARSSFVTLFTVFACACAFLTPLVPDPNSVFHGQYRYHEQVRWSGIWQNPNIFGLIMAVALMFSLARAWSALKKAAYVELMFWSIPAAIAGASIVKSYSRGAWAATVCGIAFFVWNSLDQKLPDLRDETISPQPVRFRKLLVWASLGFVIGFVLVCVLKFAANAQVSFAQRIFSIFSNRDFSSQNRLASFQDGINMLLDHLWIGYGWDNIIAIHSALYLQSGLSTGEAIKLNDFLMLALRLGLPLFAVFLFYLRVWLLRGDKDRALRSICDADILLCRTATLMLAISFMFTDGLFRLVSGGSFWLFLTLSFDFASLSSARRTNQSAG